MFPSRLSRLFIIGLGLGAGLLGQALVKGRTEDTVLKGRSVARVENRSEYAGSFLGSAETYVFETNDRKLVKVLYQFRAEKDILPEAFLNYAALHTFHVKRDAACDESLEHLAYGLGVNEAGKTEDHHFILKMAKDAPKVTISPDVLPCYVLTPKGLDFVSP